MPVALERGREGRQQRGQAHALDEARDDQRREHRRALPGIGADEGEDGAHSLVRDPSA